MSCGAWRAREVKGVSLTGRELSRTDGTVVGDDMFCNGGVNALLSIMM